MLSVENEKGTTSDPSVQLYGDALTKFSEKCPNTVTASDSQLKSEIQVLWLAPATGSGCVTFKGAVVVSSETWYSEDGPLTKILCENSQDSEDIQPNILKHCCACDEAKY
ncbi:Reeler domain containing protein, partial [Asbolus verrucosus]